MYSNFLLTQTYVTINVITDEVVTDMINVTTHATARAAPVGKESDSELSDPTDPVHVIQVVDHTQLYICIYDMVITHSKIL